MSKVDKKRILVVDDEIDILKVIKLQLETFGYDVITATDGLDGLNIARREKPDLIILDIMMPKMSGYKVARFLKFDEEFKNIPIIMLSGLSGDADKSTGTETGADVYLIKPFGSQELLDTIRKLL